jgi:hypothetical protein
VLESRSFRSAVDADWQRSASLGITSVPTFVLGEFALVGAQPYDFAGTSSARITNSAQVAGFPTTTPVINRDS